MSLYAIKNDRGEWYDWEDQTFWPNDACTFVAIGNHDDAKRTVSEKGGHVVELTESPVKVVVSEAEDKVLKKAKNTTVWRPAAVISSYAYDNTKDQDDEALLEDRLMRAYVIGWTVEKSKHYVLPMDGMGGNLGYSYIEDGVLWINTAPTRQYAVEHGYTVTQADIDAAPDWVRALKPVEVTDDGIS